MSEVAAPITAAEFAALMAPLGPFARNRRVVAGVSGGPDSMALAWLLRSWGDPAAAIVDHGLRPESAGEAARTAERLRALGIPSRVLAAELRPGAGAAARARAARYALLSRACREAGCTDLAVAQHADDQAETVRMRKQAGSGPRGLAGMAPVAYLEHARLLRPLLTIPGRRLRATAAAAGLGWEEDPTNRDLRTLRARLRATASTAETAAALQQARTQADWRHRQDHRVAQELAGVAIYPEAYALAPAGLSAESLQALLWMVSGAVYPPPPPGSFGSQTIGGVLIRGAGRLGPGWLLAREPGAVAAPMPAVPGVRWDGRFRLEGEVPAGLTIGALDADTPRFRRLSPLPSVVLQTLPALRRGRDVILVPHLAFPDASLCRSVGVWFCPAGVAAGAPFALTVNLGEGIGDA